MDRIQNLITLLEKMKNIEEGNISGKPQRELIEAMISSYETSLKFDDIADPDLKKILKESPKYLKGFKKELVIEKLKKFVNKKNCF